MFDFGLTLGDVVAPLRSNLVERLEKIEKRSEERKNTASRKIVVLVIYVAFLLAYSITAVTGRNNAAIFYTQDRLKALFSTRKYSDTNTYGEQLLTVRDLYEWLNTTFLDAVYGTQSFDGDPRDDKPAHNRTDLIGGFKSVVNRRGFTAGQNMLLGGIRVSQVRGKENYCGGEYNGGLLYLPVGPADGYVEEEEEVISEGNNASSSSTDALLGQDRRFFCYPTFDKQEESHADFAPEARVCNMEDYDFENPPKDGCNGTRYIDVNETASPYVYNKLPPDRRNQFLDILNFNYPNAGYVEVLPNTNASIAKQKIASLFDNGFIDYQTRALFVDMTYWSLNLNVLVSMRFVFEMPVEGTIFSSVDTLVADFYTCTPFELEICDAHDFVNIGFVILCFFLVFMVMSLTLLQVCLWTYKIASWHFGLHARNGRQDSERFETISEYSRRQAERPSIPQPVNGRRNVKFDVSEELSDEEVGVGRRRVPMSKSFYAIRKAQTAPLWRKFWSAMKQSGGWWFWHSFLFLQLSLFLSFFFSKLIAYDLAPDQFNVGGDDYINFRTSAEWFVKADSLNALFIFFSWLRLFEVITFFTSYSWKWFSFMLITFLVGSAISLQVAFGYYIYNYRTFEASFFATINSLRGDIPFTELAQIIDSGPLGLIFAITYCFILIGVFVHLIMAILLNVMKGARQKFQVDLEYHLEERREKFRTEDVGSYVPEDDTDSFTDEDSTTSLDSTEHALLDHRRRLRRAHRRAHRKTFFDTVNDFVDSDPVLGRRACPKDTDSQPSIGDIVELDASGDVDRHYSFFNPYTPTWSCNAKGRKCLKYMQQRCNKSTSSTSSSPKKNKEETQIHSGGGKNIDVVTEIKNQHSNHSGSAASQRDTTRQLVSSPSILRNNSNHGKQQKLDVLSTDNNQESRTIIKPFGDEMLLDDVLRHLECVLPQGAFGVSQKTVVALKMFGFKTPNQVAENLMKAIDVSSTYFNLFSKQQKGEPVVYTVSEAEVREVDLNRPSHRSVSDIMATIVGDKMRLFISVSFSLGALFNKEQEVVSSLIGKLLQQADEDTGQIPLSKVIAFLEGMGIYLRASARRSLNYLFGCDLSMSSRDVNANEKQMMSVSSFRLGFSIGAPFVYLESLAVIIFATLPLLSDTRKPLEILSRQMPSYAELSASLLAEICDQMYALLADIAGNRKRVDIPFDVVLEIDRIFVMAEAAMTPNLEEQWPAKVSHVVMNKVDDLNQLQGQVLDGVNDTDIILALQQYKTMLLSILEDTRSNAFDAVHIQLSLERELLRIWQQDGINFFQVRDRVKEIAVFSPSARTSFSVNDDNWAVVGEGAGEDDRTSSLRRAGSRDERLTEVDNFLEAVLKRSESKSTFWNDFG